MVWETPKSSKLIDSASSEDGTSLEDPARQFPTI
jgi:hypothetical protein